MCSWEEGKNHGKWKSTKVVSCKSHLSIQEVCCLSEMNIHSRRPDEIYPSDDFYSLSLIHTRINNRREEREEAPFSTGKSWAEKWGTLRYLSAAFHSFFQLKNEPTSVLIILNSDWGLCYVSGTRPITLNKYITSLITTITPLML